jgi:Flp pilus assembly protein TadD
MALTDKIIYAIALHKKGQENEALLMLETLARENPTDFRPQWAIAHLSRDVETKRQALRQVLKLKPDQLQAREQLTMLEGPMQ